MARMRCSRLVRVCRSVGHDAISLMVIRGQLFSLLPVWNIVRGRDDFCAAQPWNLASCDANRGCYDIRRRTQSPFLCGRRNGRKRRLGAGLCHTVCSGPARGAAAATASDINCWVAIAPDDAVTIRVAHDEMGQGAMTGLAMLVAEELDCDWNKVRTGWCRRRKMCGEPHLGRHLDRRQPLDRDVASLSAQSRRHRARNADRRGGGAMERAGGECAARKSVIIAQPERPDRELRRDRARRGEARAAGGCHA